LQGLSQRLIEHEEFSQIADDVEFYTKELPDLLPVFDRYSLGTSDRSYGVRAGIQAYLTRAVARIRAEREESVSRSPIAEAREFDFVKEDDVRAILERDYVEAQTAFAAQCWKSVIILCGGVIEATLLDLLLTDPAAACAAKGAPKGKPDLRKWDLSDVIRVAVELGVVGPGLDRLSDTLRQYRNLIHPGVELRSGLSPQKEEARIALGLLDLLHRELAKR